MTNNIRRAVEDLKQSYALTGKILEIGSLDVNGTIRDLFPEAEYIGIDLVEGSGVDIVMDSHYLEFDSEKFDGVISICTLPHDSQPFMTMNEIRRVLKPDGWLLINVASLHAPEHNNPDYWRFLPDGFRCLLEGFSIDEWIDHENTAFDPTSHGMTVLARKQ